MLCRARAGTFAGPPCWRARSYLISGGKLPSTLGLVLGCTRPVWMGLLFVLHILGLFGYIPCGCIKLLSLLRGIWMLDRT